MIEAYPLSWPEGWARTSRPKGSVFGDREKRVKPSIHKGISKVQHEIKLMKGTNLIISSNLILGNKGLPHSSQRMPEDCGIAIYFEWKGEPMVIASDNYNKPGCNLWAIGKTIESMRGIERWGCSELLNRAFTGFKQLPAKSEIVTNNWNDILSVSMNATKDEIIKAYREKAKIYHPDNDTADTEMFLLVKDAYEQGLANVK